MGSARSRVGVPGPAPLMAQRQEFAQLIAKGVSNSEACRLVGGEPAHGDTLALRAHGHVQIGGRAALSTHGYQEGDVPVSEVLVRG